MDVYRVLQIFNVTDPCLQHAVKKLLCAGGRGAKNDVKDVREAMDSLTRWQQMRLEDERGALEMQLAEAMLADAARHV